MSNSCKDLLNNKDPIDPFDGTDRCYEKYKCIFEDLQGGIIKNYGRNYSLYIFIQFTKNKNEVRQWISHAIAPNVTSTWNQLQDTKAFKEKGGREQSSTASMYYGELCTNFFLSCSGYKFIGFDLDNPENREARFDSLFRNGMRQNWKDKYCLENSRNDYWYNPPKFWDMGGDPEKAVHALLLLAHSELEELKNAAAIFINKCELIGKVITCEVGKVLRDADKKVIGPFGFADGISQPLFLRKDYKDYCEKHDVRKWDPKASLNLVLTKDPFGELHGYGSYCVFQKLETNYDCFEKKVDELAKGLGGDCEKSRERAGALVIGRFKDGTPIALSNQPNQNIDKNSFNYTDDYDGVKCPIQAHIRKTNPRKDDEWAAEDRRTKNRIFRAGITYFNAPQPPGILAMSQICLNKLNYLREINAKPLTDNIRNISGLLFVCFQSSISQQFSNQQSNWADNRKFPREEQAGDPFYLDPLIGHPATEEVQNPPNKEEWQEWPKQWGNDEKVPYGFYGCVKARGGEFLFAPSISFLKNLS